MQNILAVGLSRLKEVGDEGVFANGDVIAVKIVDVRSEVMNMLQYAETTWHS